MINEVYNESYKQTVLVVICLQEMSPNEVLWMVWWDFMRYMPAFDDVNGSSFTENICLLFWFVYTIHFLTQTFNTKPTIKHVIKISLLKSLLCNSLVVFTTHSTDKMNLKYTSVQTSRYEILKKLFQ